MIKDMIKDTVMDRTLKKSLRCLRSAVLVLMGVSFFMGSWILGVLIHLYFKWIL